MAEWYRLFKKLITTSTVICILISLVFLMRYPHILCALVLPFPSAIDDETFRPLLFLFILSPLFGILSCIVSFKGKGIIKKFLLVFIAVILLLPIYIIGEMFMRRYQPKIFMHPPKVINHSNLPVYQACIRYVERHIEDETLTFHNGYRVIVKGTFYMLAGNPVELERVSKNLKEDEVSEIKELCKNLREVGCARFQRYNNFLIFYTVAYTSPPNGPGVVYSINGANPNESDSDVLNEYKPFIKIAGNWYYSRHLMLKGPWLHNQASFPQAKFDDSLEVDEDILKALTACNK